jgi:hypothetical protein
MCIADDFEFDILVTTELGGTLQNIECCKVNAANLSRLEYLSSSWCGWPSMSVLCW